MYIVRTPNRGAPRTETQASSAIAIGDRAAPPVDTQYITARSTGRSWLAANEDGVLADYLVYDEEILGRLPTYLAWTSACIIPCAGLTAWAALRDVGMGKSVLIQGLYLTSLWESLWLTAI